MIIGDNYDALLNLLIQYRGKIDVIYIDPPYGKDSMGEFAKTNYENAITRDNLLSMLYPRLVLAKQLLSENGVIFCSIDDRNQAYVKGLFDEVFEEKNFISTLIWQYDNATMKNPSKKLAKKHDYVLIYSKSESYQWNKIRYGDISEELIKRFGKYADQDGFIRLKDVKHESSYLERIIPKFRKDHGRDPEDDDIVDSLDANYIRSVINIPTTRNKDFFNNYKVYFDNPKPIQLIIILIKLVTLNNQSGYILDFFAGSGTTGQAVLELNKEDGGKRQFILVNANEITETTPNGIVHDVTSKRLKRVMTGKCYDGSQDFEWIKKNEPLGGNLDVYDIVKVANFEATPGKTPFDVIDETLYGENKMSVNEKIKWVCENFENTQKELD